MGRSGLWRPFGSRRRWLARERLEFNSEDFLTLFFQPARRQAQRPALPGSRQRRRGSRTTRPPRPSRPIKASMAIDRYFLDPARSNDSINFTN